MKFKEFYKITVNQLHQEIENDRLILSDVNPLFESPMFHQAEYFSKLNDIKTNHPFALDISKDYPLVETITIDNTDYRLHRRVEPDCVWDFLIAGDSEHELMYAFVKYQSTDDVMSIKGLWQIDFVVGLVRSLINNFYSQHYSILESDGVANNKGKKFFQSLANDFLQRGKKVTVRIKQQEVPYEPQYAESYWKNSFGAHSCEKIILYNFDRS